MFQPFICGSSTLNHREEEDNLVCNSSSPVSTPRKSGRNSFCKSHNKNNKNPYSDRGLDKFSALLAELEEKRQKIYSQTGSEDTFVRFVYKNSTECIPIVVKVKDKKEQEHKKKFPVDDTSPTKHHHRTETNNNVVSEENVMDKHPIETSVEGKEVIKKILQSVNEEADEKKKNKKKRKSFSWKMELQKWKRPSYYLPAFVILILLFLMFFGRSVTILFTCIGWYIVPTIQGEISSSSSNVRRSMKKKDYGRKSSQSKLVNEGFSSPRSKPSSPARDHHRKF